MTKLIRIFIPIILLFCFTDCTKMQNNIPSTTQSQPTNTTNPAEFKHSFSYKKNGVLQSNLSIKAEYSPNCPPQCIQVEADDGKSILTLRFYPTITEGTYVLGTTAGNFGYPGGNFSYYNYVDGESYVGENGVLIIDKHNTTDKIIKGRFSITLVERLTKTKTISITEGQFELKYVVL